MRILLFLICLHLATYSFGQNISAEILSQNTNCQPNNGSAAAIVSGGTQPYSYLWSNGTTASTVSNLASGSYTVTVYSAGKIDSVINSFTINNSATIATSVSPNDTICIGTKVIIQATAQPSGGSFVWSGGDLVGTRNGDSIHVSPQSDQTYTITYNNPSCPGSTTLRIEAGPVKASLGGVVQPTCGLLNGSIVGAGSGYKATFTWLKDGQPLNTTASILNNLGDGNYTFILNDAIAGCSDTIKNIVLQDVSSFASVSNIAITDDGCLNKKGSIDLTVTGGSGNYTYRWSHNNMLTSKSANNLAKGSYTVTISDGVCSPFDTTIFVPGPTSTVSVSANGTDDNCSSSTGTASALPKDGTGPYVYAWSNGGTTQTINQLSGNNTYTVTVTDANGCSATANITIGDIPAPSLIFLPFDSLCPGAADGVLRLQATGGQAPYVYAWQHDSTLQSNSAANLAVGNYAATVTDAGGCTASAQIDIAAYNNPTIDLGNDTSIFKGAVAELTISTTLPVKSVEWTPFIQSANNALSAYPKPTQTTTYTATVTYGKGCKLSDQITVFVNDEGSEINIPNIFTPNNDGVNDFFYVTSKGIERIDVRVFDRWGNKVFESNEINFKWNGVNAFTNEPTPNGVFAYSIEYVAYNESDRKIAKGSVTIAR